jgi:hypothetical protein
MKDLIFNFFWVALSLIFSCTITKKELEYKYINKAYHQINIENYRSATKYFKKAYKKKNIFFAADYYNAMQAAILGKDSKFVETNAFKLCELGMCTDFFKLNPHLSNMGFLSSELLQACITKNSFNSYLKDTLYKMMQEDQLIHHNPQTHHLRREVDSTNFEEFKNLLREFGFPSERRIGINCTQSLGGIQKPFHHILLSHFFGQEFNGIHELNKQWLDSNFISPRLYFRMNALANKGRIIAGGEILKLKENYYIELPKNGGIKKINRIRRENGLWPISEEIRIIRNHKDGKNSEFYFDLYVVNLPDIVPIKILEKKCIKIY